MYFYNRQKTADNFNHRLYFVLDTIIKCIWIKTQLIVEFNLVFLAVLPISSKRTSKPKYSPWLSWTRRFKFLHDGLSGCKSQKCSTYGWMLWQNSAKKWYACKYFYILQILTNTIKQRLYSTTSCICGAIQLVVEYEAHFVLVTKSRQKFYTTDMSSYTPENRNRIQPVLVLSCKYNITMRFLNEIQLILESNRDFQGFINTTSTHPEIQPAVEFGLRFLILITPWMPRHMSAL